MATGTNNRREINKLVRWVKRQPGWDVERDGCSHHRLLGPDGQRFSIASSPRGRRAFANVRARCRRMGLADMPRNF